MSGAGGHWDLAVVGAGVAGLTAARVAAESGLRVVVHDRLAPGGQLVNLTALHDHPSRGVVAEPWAVVSELVAAAEAAGVTTSFDEVTRVRPGAPVRLTTTGGDATAAAVVIATGLSAGRLGLPGEEQLVGRGLSTCAGCDGPLYRGTGVAVVGSDEWTAEEALELAGLASAVTVVVPERPTWSAERGRRLAAADRVTVLTGGRVTALHADGVLAGLTVRTPAGERELAVRGVFPYVGRTGPAGLVEGAAADEQGRLSTGDGLRADVPGVFVAGDARAAAPQTVAAALADGAAAGRAAAESVRGGGPVLRVVDPTAGFAPVEEDAATPAGGSADWTEVALFSNSKPNATELLQGMGERLREHWQLAELHSASKPNASAAADGDLIDWLAQRYRMVVVAVGD